MKTIKKIRASSLMFLILFGSCSVQLQTPEPPIALSKMEMDRKPIQTGIASFYASEFSGSKTASGEKYDPHQLTAAHKTLPFGTNVEVINIKNGKSVTVKINDRGPYKKGWIIDLSKRAAQELNITSEGVTKVELIVDPPESTIN